MVTKYWKRWRLPLLFLALTAVAGWRWMAVAVVILIASLIPLTTLWPAALRGEWTRYFAAIAALGSPLSAVVMIIVSTRDSLPEDISAAPPSQKR